MSLKTFATALDHYMHHIRSCSWCSELMIDGEIPHYRQHHICKEAMRLRARMMVKLYSIEG
jgi:recombinational DNA repair protein RecR